MEDVFRTDAITKDTYQDATRDGSGGFLDSEVIMWWRLSVTKGNKVPVNLLS